MKVNNNASFRKDCVLSDKPKWGTCDYVWTIGSNETTTNSKSTYSIAPHVRAKLEDYKPTDFYESVELKMTYHPENLGGHTGTTELTINANGKVTGLENGNTVSVEHHCGMHNNHMWVTPYIEVDDPVYIRNEDGNRVIPVGYTDRNKLKLHIDPCSFKNSNSLELQVIYDDMYHKVNSYEGTLKPGETIKIGYDDIFGTNYNENYLNHIGKTLKFQVVKTMIDGEKQGSNELHVLFYKEAPDFSVQTYTPACKQDGVFKYATITLKNRDDEVFVWDENVKSSICTWDVLDEKGSLNRFDSVERVEQGVYKLNWGATFTITQAKSIQLSSVTMVDSSVVNAEGFDYAKEVKPKIDEPKNVVIKEENKTKVDNASVTQFTPMRSYFGGYDNITTNQEKYQASIIISDYSENSEISGATLRYRKAGTSDENSKSTLVMPTTDQELEEIINKISEKCADDIINEKPDWKNYYREHYFNDKFKPLKYGYYSAPKITKSDKIVLSMSVVRLIVKLSDNKYRITSASPYFASETIAESSATATNGYSFCDITGLDKAFYNSWSKNVDLTSFTSYDPRMNAENSFVLLEKNPPQKQHLSHIYLKNSDGSYEYQYQVDQESSITVVLIESQERDYSCVNRIGSCLLCIGKGTYYTMNFDSDRNFPYGGGRVFSKLTVEGSYQQSVMNNYGKCVAVRTILKEDRYCIYATNSTNQKKWTLTSREVELLGIDNDFVYLKDTRDGHTYRLSFNDPDGEIYFELDRDTVFQQWLKEGKGFKEIEEAYKQFKIDEYKAHNIGYQLDVEGNTIYNVWLVDSDGCETDKINVEVKVPDNLLTHKIIKDPTDNCSKDGKVIISTIIKGIEFKVWKSGEDEQHKLKYDEHVEFDNLGMNDSIIEYCYSDPKDNKGKNGKYLIHFQHTSNIPKITEILPETKCRNGVIIIYSNKLSDTYNVYKNTEKICSSTYGKYISNLEQGTYYATINYKNEGCASPQSKVQVN
ncbi:MAG: hypothetical protein HUJ96_03320, partial [Marinilabiliaceae bacterium]|nr:hypothetical protein [Marinilabiliaceae bacterium]